MYELWIHIIINDKLILYIVKNKEKKSKGKLHQIKMLKQQN